MNRTEAVQARRKSNAAGPHGKKYNRPAEKAKAIRDSRKEA